MVATFAMFLSGHRSSKAGYDQPGCDGCHVFDPTDAACRNTSRPPAAGALELKGRRCRADQGGAHAGAAADQGIERSSIAFAGVSGWKRRGASLRSGPIAPVDRIYRDRWLRRYIAQKAPVNPVVTAHRHRHSHPTGSQLKCRLMAHSGPSLRHDIRAAGTSGVWRSPRRSTRPGRPKSCRRASSSGRR